MLYLLLEFNFYKRLSGGEGRGVLLLGSVREGPDSLHADIEGCAVEGPVGVHTFDVINCTLYGNVDVCVMVVANNHPSLTRHCSVHSVGCKANTYYRKEKIIK